MESVDPQKAAYYHLATADLHEIEEKYREAASAVRAAVNMYAKARQWVMWSWRFPSIYLI